jgi:hypothetical protein
MKILIAAVTVALVALAGCGGDDWIDVSFEAEDAASASITAGGGDPSDWVIYGSCPPDKPCTATIDALALPGVVLATNRYEATGDGVELIGPDNIREAARSARERRCFQRFTDPVPLTYCVAGRK